MLAAMNRCRCALLGLMLGCGLASPAGAGVPDLPEYRVRDGLPNVFQKLERKGEVRIAYLGGSITAQPGWRPKTLAWFQKQFPEARVIEINAAIGGTGSDLGVFRLQHDVLRHDPDLLFVEFAVNDGGAPPDQIHRCMEGIVRQSWRANPETDICYVYTIAGNMLQTLQAGSLPRSVAAMEQLADHYGIPSINFGVEIARMEQAGRLVFKGTLPKTDAETAALGGKIVFSPDAVHPFTETGHEIYLQVATRAFEAMRSRKAAGLHLIPSPFSADHLEAAKLVPLSRVNLSARWERLPETNRLVKSFGSRLPELWRASQAGEAIEFRFRGTAAGIYDLVGPDCGQVVVRVDDQPPVTRPRFDAYCTYHRLASFFAAKDLPEGVHRVRIEIHPDQPDKAKILAQRNETIDDPKRFDDRAWYAGAVMLVGDLVESQGTGDKR